MWLERQGKKLKTLMIVNFFFFYYSCFSLNFWEKIENKRKQKKLEYKMRAHHFEVRVLPGMQT